MLHHANNPLFRKVKKPTSTVGFTIVELLIVIVVIAILAAITIVAYNGIQNRAKASAAQTTVKQAAIKIQTYAIENGDSYPENLATVGIANTDSIRYQYRVANDAIPKTFCITTTVSNKSYYISNTQTTPTEGACNGHALNGGTVITNLALNPSIESDITNWAPQGNAARTVSTTTVHNGIGSLQVTTTGASSGQGTNGRAPEGSVVPGETYVFSAWVWAPAGVSMRAILMEHAGGTWLREGTVNFTGTGAWQRVSVTRTIAADSTATTVRPSVRTATATATTFYVDGVIVTAGPTIYSYADGNSEGWAWNGEVNNATSTGPPLP